MLRSVGALFWNGEEGRLRAAVRVVIFFVLWGFGPAFLHLLLGGWVRAAMPSAWLASIALDLLRLLAVLIAALIATRFVDRRPLADWGFHFDRLWWADLAFGLLLGAGLMMAIFAAEWLLGWIKITGFWVAPPGMSFAMAVLSPLVLFVVVAIAEELLSRGNQLLNFAEGFRPLGRRTGVFVAWGLSSLIFGCLHLYNPNSSWLSTAYLAFYGILLGAGFALTGELALPIGLHFTWNFFQGTVLGFPVSGRPIYTISVVGIEQQGPVLWTGGAFGPEAGLLGVIAGLAGIGLIVLWVKVSRHTASFDRLYAHMGPKPPQVADATIRSKEWAGQ